MTHLLTLYAASAAAALISATWQGALLVLCAAVSLRLLAGISAAVRSTIWIAVFAVAVVLHFIPSPHGVASHSLHAAPAWSLALAALWLALSLLRAFQLALGVQRLRQVARRAVPIQADLITPAIARRYTLCTSPDVDRPSVLGFFAPRILLPAGLLETLSPAELHQVLLHETEHLRRSDDWINLLQKLALVLFPLNPVLLWVEKRLCLERELACDDRVLRATGAPKAYATCLTHLAEHSMLHRGLSLALGALGVARPRQSELTHRVQRILSRPEKVLSPFATRFVASTLLLALSVGSITLARTPQLVSFLPALQPQSEQAAVADAPSPLWHEATAQSTSARPMLVKVALPVSHIPSLKRGTKHQAAPRIYRPAPHMISETWHVVDAQPHWTLTVASDDEPLQQTQPTTHRVQHFYLPALARVPAAYAAVATPDGWIIFQL